MKLEVESQLLVYCYVEYKDGNYEGYIQNGRYLFNFKIFF